MPDKNSEIVRAGYNKIATKYNRQRKIYQSRPLLQKFLRHLPKNPKILDLGCGSAISVAKFLDKNGCEVVGIDFSDEMLKVARKNVPSARFINMDITKMKFKEDSFDGAVSFYSIIHIPRKYHARIYRKLHKILKPGSIIMFNACGTNSWEEIAKDYLGVPMYWSFYSPKLTLKMIRKAGFGIIWSKILKIGNESQFWVMAGNEK